MKFTDEQLRDFARKVVLSCTEDIDYMGVGEKFGHNWAHLSEQEFDDVQSRVHDLATSSTVTVSWPGDQDADAEVKRLRAEVEQLTKRAEFAEAAHDQRLQEVDALTRALHDTRAEAAELDRRLNAEEEGR
ncbi:hypothetical protein [Actinomadura rugatobispora]|uniref:Uncharacterized protein n=1 Tax=Actinomadura rugatobispora TaxID=1994 RepID=A0ABW0ZNH2_9ACTN|nr:hypothetical protein GCM10010200_035820 [Actinomadura rugatobispora]